MPKLKWCKDEKKLVVLELLKGGKSVGQLARERGMSEALIYRWRDQGLKAIEGAFNGNDGKAEPGFSGECDRLIKVITTMVCFITCLSPDECLAPSSLNLAAKQAQRNCEPS